MSSSSAAPKYTLEYFDIRGLGEMSRILFKIAGQEFEDKRFPYANVDGKAVRPEWDAAKSSYVYEQIPVLHVNGSTIAQSGAIVRFLARRFGFLGSTDIEAAQIDAAGEQIKDTMQAWYKARALPKEEHAAAFYDTEVAKLFQLFARQMEHNGAKSGCLIGAKLSLVDVQLWNFIETVGDKAHMLRLVEKEPRIKHVYHAVAAIPALQKWIEERPKTAV